MQPRWIVIIAALSGLVAVGIGAIGAHGMPERLKKAGFDEPTVAKKVNQCEIGVRYQAYHALAMLAIGLSPLPGRSHLARAACGMFVGGILFFCGGLYSLSMADFLGHWSIVPMGGLMFMIGWGLLLLSAATIRPDSVKS